MEYDNNSQLKNDMKSALIITGNLRSFEKCYNTFEELIQNFDCDIFMCISNIQFDLHPHIKSTNHFYNDAVLSLELLTNIFNISPIITKKIKKIILLDKIEEDDDVINNFLPHFDKKKDWIGIDMFKQYYKIKKCIDFIKTYEMENGFQYNYVIKTRFDVHIDMNSLPVYPLLDNTIYSSTYGSDIINDMCIISHSIKMIEIICNDIKNHFFDNYADISAYNSIHTLLYFIFTSNHFNSIQCISSNINREYSSCFDFNITLVTCFYNINRDNWDAYSRPIEKYFINAGNVLNKKNPIVIFTTENYVNKCIEIRKKTDIHLIYTKIIILPFEELLYYDKMETIRDIQKKNIHNIPNNSQNCPEFCIPEYIIVINNKTNFLKKVVDQNFYNSQIFQWVDFGFHENLYHFNNDFFNETYFSNIFYKKDKIKISSFLNPTKIHDKKLFYNSHYETVAAGLIGGDKNAIYTLYSLCKDEFEYLLNNQLMNQEQYIYYYLLCENTDLFDYSIINRWDDLCKYYYKNTTKIAICMSGHTRTFDLCRDNITTNIINPLIEIGCNVNIFYSTWNDDDYNNSLSNLKNFCTDIEVEDYDADSFFNNFSSNQYLNYHGLCCHTTSSNASSMYYKMKNVYNLCNNYSELNHFHYDIIIRIRPDVIYSNIIDIGNIKYSLLNDYLYMPFSHGKYISVTKNIFDYFIYGNINVIKNIMNTFYNIQKYILLDFPHTAEGFLYNNIIENNIIVNRFICVSGIIRKNNIYEKLFN